MTRSSPPGLRTLRISATVPGTTVPGRPTPNHRAYCSNTHGYAGEPKRHSWSVHASSQAAPVQLAEIVREPRHRILLEHPTAGCFGHSYQAFAVVVESGQGERQRARILHRYKQAVLPVSHYIGNRGDGGRDGNAACRHRLQKGIREAFHVRREDKQIRFTPEPIFFCCDHATEKLHAIFEIRPF